MLKRLNSFILKSYLGPLVFMFFVAEFVLILQFVWLFIDELVGKGLEWGIIADLFISTAAGLVNMALPLAILLASVMTFGKLGEDFELSAMKSAGISLYRIMYPLIVFSFLLGIGSFFWSNYIVPYTNLRAGSLLYDVGKMKPELNIIPGVFNSRIEDISIKISSKNPNTGMMYDFLIYDHTAKRGNIKVTRSDSGFMQLSSDQKYMVFTLYNGRTFEEMQEENKESRNYPERNETFEKQTIFFELKDFDLERTKETLFKQNYQTQSISELRNSIDSMNIIHKLKKNRLITELVNSNYLRFSKENWHKPTSDSLSKFSEPKTSFVTSHLKDITHYLKSIDSSERELINASAIENAQNVRNGLESNRDEIEQRKKRIFKYESTWYQKFTLPVACLVFFFIGAPLGAIIRKGGFGLPVIASIVIFILYYIISMMGLQFTEEGVLMKWFGMWLSTFVIMILGIVLTYKASNDSEILNFRAFVDKLQSLFKLFEIQYKDPALVFYKNVAIPNDSELKKQTDEFRIFLTDTIHELTDKSRSVFTIYMSLYCKNNFLTKNLIEKYNNLYDILAVNYRNNVFLKANLEKFPKIEQKAKPDTKILNIIYFVSTTILLIPFGILLLFRQYLVFKVLKQRIEMILHQLQFFP